MTDPSNTHPADGTPAADRREQVLDPSAGAVEHSSASIRDEQSTHEAGAVPAAFMGDAGPTGDTRPEDAEESDEWDSAAHRG
jgi:hypothetical protein